MELNDHFDTESLTMLKEVMEEEFGELIDLFVADGEDRLPKMRTALEIKDAANLMGMAHSFKGASGNVCAAPLSALNMQVEEGIRGVPETSVDWPRLADLLKQVEDEFSAVKQVISQHL